jgi:hypothetical protein
MRTDNHHGQFTLLTQNHHEQSINQNINQNSIIRRRNTFTNFSESNSIQVNFNNT